MTDTSGKIAFSIKEAAKKANCCRDKIYSALNESQLRGHKFGRNTIILADDLETFLKSLPEYTPKSKTSA